MKKIQDKCEEKQQNFAKTAFRPEVRRKVEMGPTSTKNTMLCSKN